VIDGYAADSHCAAYKNDRQQPLRSGRLGNDVRFKTTTVIALRD
jgi:hypothetical protein